MAAEKFFIRLDHGNSVSEGGGLKTERAQGTSVLVKCLMNKREFPQRRYLKKFPVNQFFNKHFAKTGVVATLRLRNFFPGYFSLHVLRII